MGQTQPDFEDCSNKNKQNAGTQYSKHIATIQQKYNNNTFLAKTTATNENQIWIGKYRVSISIRKQ